MTGHAGSGAIVPGVISRADRDECDWRNRAPVALGLVLKLCLILSPTGSGPNWLSDDLAIFVNDGLNTIGAHAHLRARAFFLKQHRGA